MKIKKKKKKTKIKKKKKTDIYINKAKASKRCLQDIIFLITHI